MYVPIIPVTCKIKLPYLTLIRDEPERKYERLAMERKTSKKSMPNSMALK